MKSFNELPIEMQFAVFGRLGVKSLANCRLVCKAWQTLSDQMKPTELVLNALDELPPMEKSWHFTGEPIDEDSLINRFKFKNFRMMAREITLNLSRLKRLKIACHVQDCGPPHGQLFDEFFLLNAFVRLEHLELATVLNMRPHGLRLPNLRFLRIRTCRRAISIDAPKLEVLSCAGGFDELKLEHPLSVVQLETREGNALARFPNVQIFKSSSPALTDGDSILDQLPKLKELHLVVAGVGFKRYEPTSRILVDSLIEERVKKNKKLKIFFLGHLLEGDKRFDDYDFKAKFPLLIEEKRIQLC